MKIRNYWDYLDDEDNDDEPMPRKSKTTKKVAKKPKEWVDDWGLPQKDAKKAKRNRRVKEQE